MAPLQATGHLTLWDLSGTDLGDRANYYVSCLFGAMKVCLKFCIILVRHGIEHNLYSLVLVMPLPTLALLPLLPLFHLLPLLLVGRGQGGNVFSV